MTLGEIKDAGHIPTATQIHALEIEVSKKCNFMGSGVHTFHVQPAGTDQIGRPHTWGDVCWHIKALWRNLEEMFPGIKIDKYEGWR